MTRWTSADIRSQAGRCAVVTGTGGLGYQDALALARAECDVIIAGRDPAKGEDAVTKVREAAPHARVRFEVLDLASLASIAAFSERMHDQRDSLDLLINNAGVMVPPTRRVTADGFELQFGVNYLGHFALTAGLMPLLRRSPASRVVSVSSLAAREGQIDFDDINARRRYRPMSAYSQSKLACLIFALELQRRSEASNWGVLSVAAHPGIARTSLLHNGPGRLSATGLLRSSLWFLFQPAAKGALPTLFAATSPHALGGAYYGPDGLAETRGFPAVARVPQAALDTTVAARLWELSEQLTHTRFA